MGYRRPSHREEYFHKREYAYDPQTDGYRCPAGQIIVYHGTNRTGYREYASDPGQCRQCPQRARCTQSRNHQKLITRHLWQRFKEQIDAHRLTDLGKRLYALRKETVERSFADAKELHGHRYARFRGLAKVQAQCLLSATCQSMKKMVLLLTRRAAALLSLKFQLAGTLTGVLRRQHIPNARHGLSPLSGAASRLRALQKHEPPEKPGIRQQSDFEEAFLFSLACLGTLLRCGVVCLAGAAQPFEVSGISSGSGIEKKIRIRRRGAYTN